MTTTKAIAEVARQTGARLHVTGDPVHFDIPCWKTYEGVNKDRTNIETDHVLVTPAGTRRGIGAVPRGEEGRKTFGGPMIPGPWAYTYGLATCIDTRGGTAAEMRKLNAENKVHHVKTGDTLTFDDVTYTIRVYRRDYIALDPVEADNAEV